MMKLAMVVLALSLVAGSAVAEGPACAPMTPYNVYITWTSASGACSQLGGTCDANDRLTFELQSFGYSFSCAVMTVNWDFGDGTSATTKAAAHQYAAAGRYDVSVRITTSQQQLVLTSAVEVAARGRRRVAGKESAPPPPLDEVTLRRVTLEDGSVELQPGQSRQLQLLKQECCVSLVPVSAAAQFSIDPTPYAAIDRDGIVTVSPAAPGGISIRAYANIEDGRRIISTDIYVDTPESNPLRGSWTETAEIPCDSSPELVTVNPPLSLAIHGGNHFDAGRGLEIDEDYNGLYTFDRSSGTVTFGVQSGDYVPPSLRGEGAFTITNEDGWKVLRLKNIWFGRPRGDMRAPACGIVFRGGRW